MAGVRNTEARNQGLCLTLIRRGLLSDLFVGAAVKRLSVVETSPEISNQHEFNGAGALRALFGDDDRRNIPARFIWLGEEQEGISADGMISWYDARRRHPTRTEYRLYYPTNPVTDLMEAGDSFFVALRSDETAMIIVTPAASTLRNQLLWLFGLEDQAGFQFVVRDIDTESARLDYAARYILDELGIDLEEPEADRLDGLLDRFGMSFPTTRVFSELARSAVPHVSPLDDPDAVIMAWVEQEELLFRRLERRIVAHRLRSGFMATETDADVEGFLSFSLSVQNRRKSRAGQSLEHHLETLFLARSIRFARGVETENRNRPDFLFPGQAEYRDASFPSDRLAMLGAKSTLKDRWRQVLAEATRVKRKHLITLQPAISEAQTDQMQAAELQLVVPAALHATFRERQKAWLMNVEDFVRFVASLRDDPA